MLALLLALVPPVEEPIVPRDWAGPSAVYGIRPAGFEPAGRPTPYPAALCTTLQGPSGLLLLPLADAVLPGKLAASIHRFTLSAAFGVAGFGEQLNGFLPSLELAIGMDVNRCEQPNCQDAGDWGPFYRGWRLSAKLQILSQAEHGIALSVTGFRARPAPFFDGFSRMVLYGDSSGARQVGRESRVLLSAGRTWRALNGGGLSAGIAAGGVGRVALSAWQSVGRHLAALAEYDRLQIDDETSTDPWSFRCGVRVVMGPFYKLDLFVLAIQRMHQGTSLADILDNHVWVGVGYGGS